MKLKDIKGIGPKKENSLKDLGINSIDDLIYYFPKKYEDRSNKINVIDSIDGFKGFYELEIKSSLKTYFYSKNKSISTINAKDDTGDIKIIWYNDRFSGRNLLVNNVYKFFGIYNSEKKAIINPITTKIDDDAIGGITPIYSSNKKISSKDIIKYIKNAFDMGYEIGDYLSQEEVNSANIYNLYQTLYELHRPTNNVSLYKAFYSLNLRNLFLEKLVLNQLNSNNNFIKFEKIDISDIINKINFELTESQNKVLEEIFNDMTSEKKMNRILIGDVGSGKTIIAILSAIYSIRNNYQVAFMAPTELLARQHYKNYKDLLESLGIKSEYLIGDTRKIERDNIYDGLEKGKINIIFGTHSLFQEKVNFNNLGLIIIDEQQRFGVHQRRKLFDKGYNPDTLLLSATPIPRTLALALYNKLDISYMDTLPRNRLPIKSYLSTIYQEMKFMDFAYKQIQEGRQVYVIASRVEDDEDLESVDLLYKKLKKYFNQKIKIDILHGKMSSEEKEEKQSNFLNKKVDMLVATSIVEVGIDVPNANTIIIYDAQQFGLSQLHQLRGRVGRSHLQSYCFFVVKDKQYINEKLEFITNNLNGFEIAKKDLEIRGSGSIYGTEQSGNLEIENSFILNETLVESSNRLVENADLSNQQLKYMIDNKIKKTDKIILN